MLAFQRILRQRDATEAARRDRHRLIADLEAGAVRVANEPQVGCGSETAHLLGRDHLDRVPEPGSGFRLDLAEDKAAPAPEHEVELVPSGPGVRGEHAVAPQPVVEPRATLGRPAGATCRARL